MNQSSQLLKRLEPQIVQELAGALRTPDKRTRLDAARKLADRGKPAVDALIDALDDPDAQVWQMAFAALLKIGDPAVPSLMATLEHPKHSVGLMAAAILLRMGISANSTPRLAAMQQELLHQVTASRR